MKTTTLSRTGIALIVVAAALAIASSAVAASVTATATITAGTLSLSSSAAPSFSVTLNGSDQTASYTAPMTITDSTGSGSGWNATITSTQFSTSGGKTLPTSASSVTAVSASCVSGATCTDPTNSVSYPLAVPAASTAPTAVKLFNAALNTGMGQFTVTPTVSVTVPGNAYAGTYTSTLTLAIVSGP